MVFALVRSRANTTAQTGEKKENIMVEMSRGEINDLISNFATKNPEYKKALLADPKKVVGMQLGQELPESLNVSVIEDTADMIHMVLPYVPQEGAELSDADLEMVAGGKGGGGYTCNDIKGIGTHVEITTKASLF
jgi:hypothetical protein